MNTQAIFSSQSPDYLIPFQPGTGDTVKVRLRTRKEDRIQCVLVIDDGQEEKKIPMTADLTLKTDQLFLWYAAEFRLGRAPLHYYFEITANELRAHEQPAANELRAHGRPAANELRAGGRPGPETVLYYGRRGFFTKTEAREAADDQQTSSEVVNQQQTSSEVANEVANELRGD
ncbi:MAG: alpha amylase N-terminal ig-like domain-containing protein, partial [Lachnospiraceae bacterium]|nr:alpha amylase N-terminal ig-like domain-containing protein [Lachnospiraceae bacterium]